MAINSDDLAAGQVVTGFSFPVVALYKNTGGTVTYENGMDLARGVSVDPDIETANDDNVFYANNRSTETAQKRFRSGTVGLTVDGLLTQAERLIMGIPAASQTDITIGEGQTAVTVGMTDYGDGQLIPYVGVGYVVRSMSNGIEMFRAVVYTKTRFDQFVIPAATEEDEIDWQTTDLSAQLMRDDTSAHNWQRVSEPVDSELLAYNVVRSILGMATVDALPTT